MVGYALSLARSHKSDESHSQGLLVLEQCESTQRDDNSKGVVLLAASTLLYERENFDGAIDKLQRIKDLSISSVAVQVAAAEALAGLHLELCQDDAASVHADLCLQLLDIIKLEIDSPHDIGVLDARIKAIKGLVELVLGDPESSDLLFQGVEDDKCRVGNVALSHGEFLHATRKLSMAKEYYRKAIQGISENNDFSDPYNLAACNMTGEEVLLAATCGLGQLEAHLGNFADAEEILTRALTRAEEHFGSRHPKVGVVLTCIALMFRHKATVERSSALLVQEILVSAFGNFFSQHEPDYVVHRLSIVHSFRVISSIHFPQGLYRRAIELLKAPPLEGKGGYAETLCLQQNRKAEGERMKSWAETTWGNRRLSLAEALEVSENSSMVPVIDARISRVV
ncbi:hypothetical protein RJ639_032195 [Escallonia herrerae]|uniref:Uncharacterized protein n=1 Tax=Escallonia herrerae TaxID=1293975 RepID=A0AA89BA89_9ASTE|nr:hypothetical protein RJ639_032195 [Escallonia herrerae]